MSKPDLLIDADMTLYQAAAVNEVETDWGDSLWTLHSDATRAMHTFKQQLDQLQDELHPGEIVLCFSDPTRRTFRHDLSPTYKANRKGTRKPLAYASLRDQAMEKWKTIIKPRLEADDCLGIISTRAPGRFIIVSGDKDLCSVPGMLYRNGELTEITEAQADFWHMRQTLTGDATDGYPGCPGIGPVKAEKIISEAPSGSVWQAVVAAFKKAKLTEADALLQARLARILRASDWRFDTSEVKLWTP